MRSNVYPCSASANVPLLLPSACAAECLFTACAFGACPLSMRPGLAVTPPTLSFVPPTLLLSLSLAASLPLAAPCFAAHACHAASSHSLCHDCTCLTGQAPPLRCALVRGLTPRSLMITICAVYQCLEPSFPYPADIWSTPPWLAVLLLALLPSQSQCSPRMVLQNRTLRTWIQTLHTSVTSGITSETSLFECSGHQTELQSSGCVFSISQSCWKSGLPVPHPSASWGLSLNAT